MLDKKVIKELIKKLKPFIPKQEHYSATEIGNIRIRQLFTDDIASNKQIALRRVKQNPKNIKSYLYVNKKDKTVNRIIKSKLSNQKMQVASMPISKMISDIKFRADFKYINSVIAKMLNK